MSDTDHSALVPRPPGALEKSELNGKRILAGMIADTLAQAKKGPSNRLQRSEAYGAMLKDGPAINWAEMPALASVSYEDQILKKEPQAPARSKFRIGESEWCEPDYRQILIWAKAMNLKPENVVLRLFGGNSGNVDDDGKQMRLLAFFDEPLVANGKMLKLSWDLRQLPYGSVEWVDGLEITHLRFIGGLALGVPPLRCLNDIGRLPLPKLVWLACRWQNLTAFDLSGVTCLKYLYCNCNRLRSLDLATVPELRELDCEGNQVETLDFANNRRLSVLSCDGNNLSTLDLSGLDQLEQVSCEGNSLSELNLLDVPSLRTLSCFGNDLQTLDLSQVPSLESLECSHNQIWRLDLNRCPQITFLDCRENPIRELDIRALEQLETLNYDAGKTRLIQRQDQHFD